ncbi:alpha/beta hydrolase family protein [Dactylosporangium sp. CA-233914]|uniref:alpha/beta hydrolase family protein n=1 Tax=Dactylosporangium sp. CA-233914 TaxID=3239934 RepID=UPI003D8F316D
MHRSLKTLTAVLVAALVAALAPGPPAGAEAADLTSTEVTFTGRDGVVLHGTVLAPAGASGDRPGVVMLEGAGNRGRGYLRPDAEAYARHGIVTLIYDKRTKGYSLLHRDYSVLADDALAGLALLRGRAGVDPARVGLWALSEGAFVAPIAAARSADVAFLVTVGAVGPTPAAQTAWAYDEYLRHAGVSGAVSRALRTAVLPAAIAAGLFPEAGFDPAPVWRQVRQPVLAEWGELDRDSVPAESVRIIRAALRDGGNARYRIRIVPGVNHNLHATAAEGFDRRADLLAGYGDAEAAWIESGFEPGPAAEGVAPASGSPAAAIAPPAWYLRPWPLVVLTVLLLAGFAVAPSWRLRVLGPLAIVGTLLYLVFLLATAGKVTGPPVLGRPLPWLGLELLVAGVVVAAALAWRRVGPARGRRMRLGAGTAAAVLLVPWAAAWGLFNL